MICFCDDLTYLLIVLTTEGPSQLDQTECETVFFCLDAYASKTVSVFPASGTQRILAITLLETDRTPL